jgi:hypothetical protein
MQTKLLGTTNAAFQVIGQRLIRFFISVRYWRKSGSILAQYIKYLHTSRKLIIRLGGKHYTTFSLSSEYPETSGTN